jgi:hypothetical protein
LATSISPPCFVEDDRGGNLVAVTGPCRCSRHAVWDGCIAPTQLGTDYAAIASQLRAEITAADRARWLPGGIGAPAVVSWANESFAIARRQDVHYCIQKDGSCWYAADRLDARGAKRVVTVDGAYLAAEADTVRERLKAAGVRLAAILNTVLASDVHTGN